MSHKASEKTFRWGTIENTPKKDLSIIKKVITRK